MENGSKDPLISFRSVMLGKNKKGGDRIQLYLGGHTDERGNEVIKTLIEALTAGLENPRGVKLDLHVNDRESEDGRTFKSAFGFVKQVEDRDAQKAPPKKFVPVSGGSRTAKLNKTIA